jgi:TetR/AcrR family transcriptional regulator, ethionamide resistance regulator
MSEKKKLNSPLRVTPTSVLKVSKSARTRAAILNSALDFLWTRPFREMTIASLMAGTDVGRSAFYQHFTDLHEVMVNLLEMVQGEIFEAAEPFITGNGDPMAAMHESLAGLVRVGYDRGPFLRAIVDATTTDGRLELVWKEFLDNFDKALTIRIEANQEAGLTEDFDAQPVAFALNRLDAYTLIQAFGRHPRKDPEPVREALTRIWNATLYNK